MSIDADLLDLPLRSLRPVLSRALDRHLANAAGTIGGAPMRGIYRAEWTPVQGEWGHVTGSTRSTLSIDADTLQAGFPRQPPAPEGSAWHEGSSPLYLTDSDDQILTDSDDQPLTLGERASGMSVVITSGEGLGAYTIAEAHPADGGRVLLILEAA
jgi:hypothetical protein